MLQWELVQLEYTKLKEEQLARIGVRDNIIYLSLIAIGTICSFAISDESYYPVFLVLPWVNTILGWLYIVNDLKISAIGRYIRKDLVKMIQDFDETNFDNIFGWEIVHRSDKLRVQRKIIQCIVDLLTFPIPGYISVITFFFLSSSTSYVLFIILVFEIILLTLLSWQFIQYLDYRTGK